MGCLRVKRDVCTLFVVDTATKFVRCSGGFATARHLDRTIHK